MRPNGEELLQGVRAALIEYILPEVRTDYARTELTLIHVLLGIAAAEWDAAAQRLVDDNAALRDLARRAAEAIDDEALAGELRSLAGEEDRSLLLSDLRAANDRLHGAVGRVGARFEGEERVELEELRSEIIARLIEEAEATSHSPMGPRADG